MYDYDGETDDRVPEVGVFPFVIAFYPNFRPLAASIAAVKRPQIASRAAQKLYRLPNAR